MLDAFDFFIRLCFVLMISSNMVSRASVSDVSLPDYTGGHGGAFPIGAAVWPGREKYGRRPILMLNILFAVFELLSHD